jgi:hypothetical protein
MLTVAGDPDATSDVSEVNLRSRQIFSCYQNVKELLQKYPVLGRDGRDDTKYLSVALSCLDDAARMNQSKNNVAVRAALNALERVI